MSSREEVLAGLGKAVLDGNKVQAKTFAEKAIAAKIDPYDAIMKGCSEGMKELGEKFSKREVFIPEVLLSAEAMYAAMDVLKPHIKPEEITIGTVVLGVVEGDVHDIGKNLVKIMLEAAGFRVIDLGSDVALRQFVDKVKEEKPEIVGMSSLMTTTIIGIKDALDMFKEEGIRDKVRVLIGGSAVSQKFADVIGADSYGDNAAEAARVAKELVGKA